ncbi:MAG: 4-hydroxy-tetrahydrodipicolinate reductase [Candidatus Omnitrophica bacterium]|nr:4-hydroxy-tetrahydrodipicolinate reductase [Candidatus Omnitrophota bacterium]
MPSTKRVKVAIAGCCGRMGSLVCNLALEDASFQVTGALESARNANLGQDLGQTLGRATTQVIITEDIPSALADAQILIDFTTPEATLGHAQVAAQLKKTMLIGTTGFSPAQMKNLQSLAKKIPIFWSSNMSIGILAVRRMLQKSARVLVDFGLTPKLSVFEIHHVHKKDAPSGTAKQIKEDLLKAFSAKENQVPVTYDRKGEEIGYHQVAVDLGQEVIKIEHQAKSREIFAAGALAIAKKMAKSKPGFYTMDSLYQ